MPRFKITESLIRADGTPELVYLAAPNDHPKYGRVFDD